MNWTVGVKEMFSAKIRFTNEEDHTRGVIGLAKRMKVVGLRGGYYVIPSDALKILDDWGCQYEVIERGGYDVLVGALRGAAAAKV